MLAVFSLQSGYQNTFSAFAFADLCGVLEQHEKVDEGLAGSLHRALLVHAGEK